MIYIYVHIYMVVCVCFAFVLRFCLNSRHPEHPACVVGTVLLAPDLRPLTPGVVNPMKLRRSSKSSENHLFAKSKLPLTTQTTPNPILAQWMGGSGGAGPAGIGWGWCGVGVDGWGWGGKVDPPLWGDKAVPPLWWMVG